MGSLVLNSEHIEDIISFRDKHGSKDVVVMPDTVKLYCIGITDDKYYKERFQFWNKVYGFKMTAMK